MNLEISEISAPQMRVQIAAFARILRLCVEDDAGIGFVTPFGQEDAKAFWHALAPALKPANRRLIVVIKVNWSPLFSLCATQQKTASPITSMPKPDLWWQATFLIMRSIMQASSTPPVICIS